MLKHLPVYFLTLLIVTLLTICFRESRSASDFKIKEIKLKNKCFQDSILIAELHNAVLSQGSGNDINLKGSFEVTDRHGETKTLKELIVDKKVIYRINETNCMSCVDKYLPFLKSMRSKLGKEKIIILGSFSSSKDLYLTLEKYPINDIPVYNLNRFYLEKEKIEQLNIPYVFEIDTSFYVSHMFIPQKHLPSLSQHYEDTYF